MVFLDAWQEASRPRLSTLRRAANALATVYAIEGATEEEKTLVRNRRRPPILSV